jgi:hypothetical protein
MRILAAVTSRASVTRILGHAHLPTEPPRIHPPRPPPQQDLPLGEATWAWSDPEPAAFEPDPPSGSDFDN